MNPVDFPEANHTLGAPKGIENCVPLRVHTNLRVCTSVWELTDEELAMLVRSRRLAIGIYSGTTQPPMHIQVLEEGQAPYLQPLQEVKLKESYSVSSKGLGVGLSDEETKRCKTCGHIEGLHMKFTKQCPAITTMDDKSNVMTGFLATIFKES